MQDIVLEECFEIVENTKVVKKEPLREICRFVVRSACKISLHATRSLAQALRFSYNQLQMYLLIHED